MKTTMAFVPSRVRCRFALGLLVLATVSAHAQAPISRPVNSFTPGDDVELGQAAAEAVLDRLAPLKDAEVARFVGRIGRRLSDAIPAELRQPMFRYDIGVLNVRDVTSFAFPGGPIFISARMIELAGSEDALAGLLAHELAHVVLRHATAQLSAGEPYQIGAITGRQVGLSAAAPMPGILERGANFSIASYFFRFAPAPESDADALGIKLAQAAGYDPNGLVEMVGALKGAGAAYGGLDWLGRHPKPRSGEPAGVSPSSAFASIQARVRAIPPPARSIGNTSPSETPVGTAGSHVPPPEGESRSVTAGDNLLLSVPANWRRLLSGNTVIFAPEGAFVALRDGPAAITHGIQVGIARSTSEGVEGNTPALFTALARNNARLTWTPAMSSLRVAGRDALTTTMNHVSPVTGEFEAVTMTALRLSDDSFLYFLSVAPQIDAGTYRRAFDRVVQSLQILD